MKYTNEELKDMWYNEIKRRDFLKDYKKWGVFTKNKELNLKFYKFELPDKQRIIVMEHMTRVYHPRAGDEPFRITTKIFLEKADLFSTNPVNESVVCAHLKELKMKIIKGDKGLSA